MPGSSPFSTSASIRRRSRRCCNCCTSIVPQYREKGKGKREKRKEKKRQGKGSGKWEKRTEKPILLFPFPFSLFPRKWCLFQAGSFGWDRTTGTVTTTRSRRTGSR